MNTGKSLIAMTLLYVTLLLGACFMFPHSFLTSVADPSLGYAVLRGVIIALLISLLVTKPPRSRKLRAVIGAGSVLFGMMAIQSIFNYDMRLLDSVVFMEVAIILGIEALETRVVHVHVRAEPSLTKKVKVTSA